MRRVLTLIIAVSILVGGTNAVAERDTRRTSTLGPSGLPFYGDKDEGYQVGYYRPGSYDRKDVFWPREDRDPRLWHLQTWQVENPDEWKSRWKLETSDYKMCYGKIVYGIAVIEYPYIGDEETYFYFTREVTRDPTESYYWRKRWEDFSDPDQYDPKEMVRPRRVISDLASCVPGLDGLAGIIAIDIGVTDDLDTDRPLGELLAEIDHYLTTRETPADEDVATNEVASEDEG